MNDAGQYELSSAYDVLPSGQALGYQQLRVGADGADSTLTNALSMCRQFGLKPAAARAELRRVAEVVAGWCDTSRASESAPATSISSPSKSIGRFCASSASSTLRAREASAHPVFV